MAARALADVLALDQALRDLHDDVVSELAGFKTLANAVEDLIDNGDTAPENALLTGWLNDFKTACDGLYGTFSALNQPLSVVHARYAGAEEFTDTGRNWARFQDKLVADADELENRNFTRFSTWSAGGSNSGNGTMMVHNIDQAFGGDVDKAETLTARCLRSYPDTNVGQETWEVTGAAPGDWAHEEGGSARGNAYDRVFGLGQSDLAARVESDFKRQTGIEFPTTGVTAEAGNLLNDGDFEGDTLSDQWTVAGANAAYNTTSPIAGSQHLRISGDETITQSVAGKVYPGCIYGLEGYYKKTGTISAGTMTLKLRDGTTDHITISLTLSSAATSATKLAYGTVLIPKTAVAASMEVQIATTSWSGAGTLDVDNIILTPLFVIGQARAVAATQGLTPWKAQNDVFTGAITGGTDGTLQRFFNRVAKRGFEADGTATDWPDA